MNNTIQLQVYSGKDNLQRFLRAFIGNYSLRFSSISIIRDADNNPNAAFESVANFLRRLDLEPPNQPQSFLEREKRVGIYIVPDHLSMGYLETLLLRSVEDDIAIPCVRDFSDCVFALDDNFGVLARDVNEDKVKFYAYLASRRRPDLLFWDAIQSGYVDLNNAAFDDLKIFIGSM